jgi:CBS domain-containing protein
MISNRTLNSTPTEEKPVEDLFRKERVVLLCELRPATVLARATLGEALERLQGDSSGCVVVVGEARTPEEAGMPVGILTERDYLDKIASLHRAALEKAKCAPVAEYMTPRPRTIPQDESLDTAIRLMTEGGYRHLPLVDRAGRLAGVLSARDIIGYLARFFPADVMNLPPRPHQDEAIRSREGG